jgi:hypothetical protein
MPNEYLADRQCEGCVTAQDSWSGSPPLACRTKHRLIAGERRKMPAGDEVYAGQPPSQWGVGRARPRRDGEPRG